MISTQLLIILSIGIVGLILLTIYIVNSQIKNLKQDLKQDEKTDVLMEWLKEMKQTVEIKVEKNTEVLERQLNEQRNTLTQQLQHQRDAMNQQTKLIWERLDKASDVILGVQKHLGGLQEFSKDMKDLSNVLKSPKLRGGLGEQFLYELLANALPKDLYMTQYKFKEGNICDAVVKTEKGLIPIDSKFSMENFKLMLTVDTQDERDKAKKQFIKDVKNRVDEIAGKYILPAEGTTDQAIMYIPSENVYYELIVNTQEIEDYARSKNVVLSSPNTLGAFLKVLLVGYQQQELQKHASDILKALSGIRIEADKFNDELNVLDGHISRTSKSMENVKNKYTRLFGRLDSVQNLGSETKKLEEAE